MKLNDITDKLSVLNQLEQPILLRDNEHPDYMLKYRHTRELPIGFYGYFNHEIAKYMNEILNLDVAFSCDRTSTFDVYITGLRDLFGRINKGE